MNKRELERLEKKSIKTIRLNNDMKDQVIQSYTKSINNLIKSELKNNNLIVFLMKEI